MLKLQNVLMTVQNGVKSAEFVLRKNSPRILAGAGVVGIGASFVMACRATLKVNDVLTESKEMLDKTQASIGEEMKDGDVYTAETAKHDKFIIGCQTAWKLTKIYAVPVIVGVVSVGALLFSNHILAKRNIALTAAYTALNTAFKDYRNNVVERFGNEIDYQLLNNIKAVTVKEKVTDENGNEVETDKTIYVQGDRKSSHSVYGTLIAEGTTPWWEKSPLYTMQNLKKFEFTANQILMARGHLTVNEVYDMLEMPRVASGFDYGWRYYKDGNNPYGDNKVDFGLTKDTAQDKVGFDRFERGLEDSIWLNFNVDGPVIRSMTNVDFLRR